MSLTIDAHPGGVFQFKADTHIKRIPVVAEKRKTLAAWWRKIRAKDPAVARLLRRGILDAMRQTVRELNGLA